MSKFKTFVSLLSEPHRLCVACFNNVLHTGIFNGISDRHFLQIAYFVNHLKLLHLDNPKTFTEKLQWLKLYNRRNEFTTMVDKYAVKQYVANIIGDQYIIPTLGVWDKFEDIDFDSLPNQFVLKTTHGGGGNGIVICKDKATFDKRKAKSILNKSLNEDIYLLLREWPYKNVPKRIIAEKFMAPEKSFAPKGLPDYKFFCFNGEPRFCQVIRDRHIKETIDFYDMDWNHQEFIGLNPVALNGLNPAARPGHLDEMADICRMLAKDIPFVRVDLYVIDDKEYFGELTFYPASGMGVFTPEEWNGRLGDLLTLPNTFFGGGKYLIINGVISEIKIEYEELKDYKFFCFNGNVKFFKVDFGRFVEHHANYYSPEGKLLEYGEQAFLPDSNYPIEFPSNLHDMITLAEKLSNKEPFLRVDFYNVNGKIYFGELTFYPSSGLDRWTKDKYDEEIGRFLILPKAH